MVHIKVTKGLDIPIDATPNGHLTQLTRPKVLGYNFDGLPPCKLRLLVKEEETILIGQPIAEDDYGKKYTSFASGKIHKITRGEKRRLKNIAIELDEKEQFFPYVVPPVEKSTQKDCIEILKNSGLFVFIRKRPFNASVDPEKPPRSIFVQALTTAPYEPSFEELIKDFESSFNKGLEVLAKIAEVHVVLKKNTLHRIPASPKIQKHTIEGPHPAESSSLHIHKIAPIMGPEDIVWTITTQGVIQIGYFFQNATLLTKTRIALAGNGIKKEDRSLYELRIGAPVQFLIENRTTESESRYILGNPLTGRESNLDDFLTPTETVFSAITHEKKREFLHFFRLGRKKYTASSVYASVAPCSFSTSQHGEKRFFIDGSVYDAVMPMNIPTLHLLKALLAKDIDTAEHLGILEVVPEDFALVSFVCPSKINAMEIVDDGIKAAQEELLE